MKLTKQQEEFCDYYVQTGNATESYKRAYTTCKKDSVARANSSRLLTKANIREYIQHINKEIKDDRIADMQEVKEFWSDLLRDKMAKEENRIKVSELIAKTNGAFLDKVEHSGSINIINVDIEEDDEDD